MDNRSLVEKIKDETVPSISSGLAAAVIGMTLFNIKLNDTVKLFNMEMNALLATGIGVTGGVLAAEVAHDFIFERLSFLRWASKYESGIGGPVLASLATYGVFRMGLANQPRTLDVLALGASSAIAGKYLYSNIIKPMY